MPTGFDFADVVEDVVDRAGGDQTTAADIVRIRRGVRLLLERWEAQRFNTWRIRTQDVRASGRNPTIVLCDDVDDVLNVNVINEDGSESPMTRITPVAYAQLANKLSIGDPSQFWLDRQDPPRLQVYPVRDIGLRVTYVQRPAEFNRYETTADDVPGRWLEALILGLAHDLARKRPPYNEALIARLKSEASEAESIAHDADRDRTRFKFNISGRR